MSIWKTVGTTPPPTLSIPFLWSVFPSACLVKLLLLRYPWPPHLQGQRVFPVVFILILPTVSFHASVTDSFDFHPPPPVKFSYFFFNCSATPLTFSPPPFKYICQGLFCEYACLSPQFSVPQTTHLCSHLRVFSNLVYVNVSLLCISSPCDLFPKLKACGYKRVLDICLLDASTATTKLVGTKKTTLSSSELTPSSDLSLSEMLLFASIHQGKTFDHL